ncbi:MAG: hypothetical protein CVT67_05145 [Actinobacteria bacterium HGW-Actinobacteria-7]|jgi:hypothetical protein|nr:MAG: hypothetical protein CVT67_05145 [Actinobacteria bacterium HGW-Actinobacteria-7]
MYVGAAQRWGRLIAILALVTALSAGWAASAFAAPADESMGLSELQQMIDTAAGDPVNGYLKTVLRGSTIETIPVEIIAITSDDFGASNAAKALIIFEAKGPKIDKIGGIAAGMSGSPIYVNDGVSDKVVGALSYGDWFSMNGAGLATPIDAMIAVAGYPTDPKLTMSALSVPAATSAGLVKDIVITSDAKVAAAARGKYTFVAKPYSVLSIGALPPASPGYKKLAALTAGRGYDVLPLNGALGMSKSDWSVPFEPGAGVAALASWGDFWVGGIGTATYVDSDTVLAFGHPMDWTGSSNYAFANAWIDYVWPSTYDPYKVGRPGMVRGTVTQDRGAAILGRTDIQSKVTTMTSNVLDLSTGNQESGTSYMPRAFATGDWSVIPGYSSYQTALRACDDYACSGSAVTTTTVVVSDGVNEYTIARRNVWNDSYDVAWTMIDDAYLMVDSFWGLKDAQVLSVDFQAVLDPQERFATIVDVEAPEGLKANTANRVTVSILEDGNPTTQTVDVTLTIPANVPTSGELVVTGGSGGNYYDGQYDEEDYYYDESPSAALSTSQTAAALQAELVNSDLGVTFYPSNPNTSKSYDSIEATAATPWYLEGSVAKSSAFIELFVMPSTINYGGETYIMGSVDGVYRTSGLKIYGRSVDSTASTLLRSLTIKPDPDEGYDEFDTAIYGLKKTSVLTVWFDGDQDTLRSQASATVKVRAAISLAASATKVKYGKYVTLRATLAPSGTAGKVVFERYVYGSWRTFATRTISGNKAYASFKPSRGTNKVRARYLGGTVNSARTSYTKAITAK